MEQINKTTLRDNDEQIWNGLKGTEADSIENIKKKYKTQTDQLNIFENKDNTISINNLVVKENLRNKGIGQNILSDIIAYADKNNKIITLTPTSEYNTKNKFIQHFLNFKP